MEFLDLSMFALIALVAFVAGFIDAIAGGGGMITVPALLSVGLPPHVALATNKLSATFGSTTAAYAYYKKRLFHPALWKRAILSTIMGAALGTLMVSVISSAFLNKFLPLLILATAIYSLLQGAEKEHKNVQIKLNTKIKKIQFLQGSVLGFYDGFAGPGTGAFWTVSVMRLYRLNILIASGVAKAMNMTSNWVSLLTFAIFGQINWPLGLTMGGCLMIGAYLGAHSAIRFGGKFIRPIFTITVSVLALKLFYQAWLV